MHLQPLWFALRDVVDDVGEGIPKLPVQHSNQFCACTIRDHARVAPNFLHARSLGGESEGERLRSRFLAPAQFLDEEFLARGNRECNQCSA